MKQQSGLELTAGEVEEYNKAREEMMKTCSECICRLRALFREFHQTVGKAISWFLRMEEFQPMRSLNLTVADLADEAVANVAGLAIKCQKSLHCVISRD